jgi:hypothetical protein
MWLRSPPLQPVPWRQLLGTVAIVWAAPLVLGWFLIALNRGLALFAPAEVQLTLYLTAMTLIFSPIYAWVGWGLALPILWLLLRDGWFGWVPALLTGAVAGACAGAIVESAIAVPYGIVALLAFRAVFFWRWRGTE